MKSSSSGSYSLGGSTPTVTEKNVDKISTEILKSPPQKVEKSEPIKKPQRHVSHIQSLDRNRKEHPIPRMKVGTMY